jgi:hypothetical protein
VIFLIALLAQAVAPPHQYPAREVLNAFSALCGDTHSNAAIDSRAAQQGWKKIDGKADSRLAEVLDWANSTTQTQAYAKKLAGRSLHAVAVQGTREVKCVVYDFDARAPVDETAVVSWAGTAPTNRRSPVSGMSLLVYEPGAPIVADRVSIAYTPAGSPANALGLIGVALSTQNKEN